MARSPRIEFEGAWYHVMARGNRREPIFAGQRDQAMMLRTLGEACGKSGWEVHAWVFMPNHFHIVLHTPQPNLAAGMKWFMNTYTRRFNTSHAAWGRLFGDRYKSLLIEPPEHAGDGHYLRALIWYVHLNPVRAGLVKKNRDGQWNWDTHPWSSLRHAYAAPPADRPAWMKVNEGLVLEQLEDNAQGQRMYLKLAARRADEWVAQQERRDEPAGDDPTSTPSSGWVIGGKSFRQSLLQRLESATAAPSNRNYRTSTQSRDHGIARAEEIIRSGCHHFGVAEEELAAARGAEPRRLAIMSAIWAQTNVSQSWIASRLGVRSAAHVSQLLSRDAGGLEKIFGAKRWKAWRNVSGIVD